MILYLHFQPEDKLSLMSKGPFVRFEVGDEFFEIHCVCGSRQDFVEQLRQQVDLLVREEARITKAIEDSSVKQQPSPTSSG